MPEFCRQCDDDGTVDEMNGILGRPHDTYLLSALYGYTETAFKYMICYYLPENLELPARFTRLSVPAKTWAVFEVPDCEMQSAWRRIWSEWFPASDYVMDEGPQFEMFMAWQSMESVKSGCR